MDGSINGQPIGSSVKWRRKGNSNKSANSPQVVNGTTEAHQENKVISSGEVISPEEVINESIPTKNRPVSVNGGAVEPPSPRRILLLKKQLEKQEELKNQHKKRRNGGQSEGSVSNGSIISLSVSSQVISRLASLNEEEETVHEQEHSTTSDLQHHFQDQYPCTLLPSDRFNRVSSHRSGNQMTIRGKSEMTMRGKSEITMKERDEITMKERSGEQEKSDEPMNGANGSRRGSEAGKMTWWKELHLYLNSLRPRTFTPSLASVTLGAVLAFKATGNFDAVIFLVTCLTVLAVHGAGNLVNTYYDFVKGVDRSSQSVNQCPDRTLVDHRLSIDQVVHLGVIAYMFGCFGFVCLVFLSTARMEHLALVYFCGISCSFLYTGGLGLKYIGLGDILIMVIFGPISILFSFMSQSGYIDPGTIAFALPLAFHTEAILHSNNTRDIESDQRAGAVTLAILIGPTFCHIIYALLLFIPYIMLIVSIIHYSIVFGLPLITITKAFQLEKNFRSGHLTDIPSATASLHLLFSVSYIISCCLIHPTSLPLLHVVD